MHFTQQRIASGV